MTTTSINLSFAKLQDDSWGVRAHGPNANRLAGTTVQVVKRNGKSKTVKLASRVGSAEGGSKAWYAIDQDETLRTRREERTAANVQRLHAESGDYSEMSYEQLVKLQVAASHILACVEAEMELRAEQAA